MTLNKSLGALLILISVLLLGLSFGHEYVEELTAASTFTIPQTEFEVAPGSKVVINFNEYSTWGTLQWNFHLDQIGDEQLDLWSPKVWIDYHETYYGSFTFTAPITEGKRTYKIKPYMYKDGTQIGHAYKMVYVTVVKPQPETYTLTVNILDENSNPIPGAEISINTGVIGTTDSQGTVIKEELIGSFTVTATKDGYTPNSGSASMTADRTVVLQLSSVVIPTDTPEPEPDATDTPVPEADGTPDPDATDTPIPDPDATIDPTDPTDIYPLPTAIIKAPAVYDFTIELLDSSETPQPIPNVKVVINEDSYLSDSSGKVTYGAYPGEKVTIVITKEGYNTFTKSYVITTPTIIKISLSDSGGDFFLDLDLTENNPFYDNEGLFGVVPYGVAAISVTFLIAGVYLFMKKD